MQLGLLLHVCTQLMISELNQKSSEQEVSEQKHTQTPEAGLRYISE